MFSSRSAPLTIPLDTPDVDIYNTNITRDGQFIITLESRQETTERNKGLMWREVFGAAT